MTFRLQSDDVQLESQWHRSSYCNGGACVEVKVGALSTAIRDTKESGQPDRTIIEVSNSTWNTLTEHLNNQ